MRLTVGQLIAIGQSGALAKLARQDFPAVAAFRLSRLIAVLEPEIANALQARFKLFTDENSEPLAGAPGQRTIRLDAIPAFQAALAPLLEEQVEVNVTPLALDELPSAQLSAADVLALGPLLKEPAADAVKGLPLPFGKKK